MRIKKVNGRWVVRCSRRGAVGWEPIEAWQVESVEVSGSSRQSLEWGRDGAAILGWFELGETRAELYEGKCTEPPVVEAQATPWQRAVGWARELLGAGSHYRLVGC
jgi:hypothetical protein